MHKLEDLEIYQLSMKVGEIIWDEVQMWDYFTKSSIGIQLIRASDSIAANIAEGYGRNSSKDARNFCYYSRGSLKETICFIEKSRSRKLISIETYDILMSDFELLGKKLNNYIKYLSNP